MKQGFFEIVAFAIGYIVMVYVMNAPSWGACLGGWMLAMWVSLGLKK